jgi:hypothetical protein
MGVYRNLADRDLPASRRGRRPNVRELARGHVHDHRDPERRLLRYLQGERRLDPERTSATVSLTAGVTVTVEFINTYTAPIPMWVSSIDMRLVVPNKNFTYATATVTVVDSAGPVAGATVTGSWSGATSATVSGTTDATGKVTFQSGQVRKPPSGTIFTFCVTNITKTGWTYDSNRNVETCDSVRVP